MNTKYKDLLKETNYMKNVIAMIITRIGDGIDTIALAFLTYEVSGSAAMVAIVYGCNSIPNLLFGFIGGGLSSYIDEKKIMFLSDLLRGICTGIIALLYLTNMLNVVYLMILTFLISTFESLRTPAQMSIFPKIISEQNREKGLALQESASNTANLIGMGVGPICIGLFGLGGAVVVDAITFLLCALTIFTMKKVPITKSAAKISVKGYTKEIKEGWKYVASNQLIINICFIGCLLNATLVPLNAFEAIYIQDYLHMDAFALSLAGIMVVAGMAITPLFLPKVKEMMTYRRMFFMGSFMFGIAYIVYAMIPLTTPLFNYVLLIVSSFLIGSSCAITNYPINITFFNVIEQSYLSRVSSLTRTISMAMYPLASMVMGVIAGIFPLTTIYYGCGGLMLLFLGTQIFNKVLYQFDAEHEGKAKLKEAQ